MSDAQCYIDDDWTRASNSEGEYTREIVGLPI